MVKDVSEQVSEFANAVPTGTIKLALFSKVFFPMFVEHLKGNEVQISPWLSETGTNGYQYVNVMNGKEVVFTVPPIFISNRTGLGDNLSQSAADIMQIAGIKEKTYPGAGDAHIRNNLIDKLDYDDDRESSIERFIEEWKVIFAYYGYEVPKSTNSTSMSACVTEDVFEDDIETF